MELQEEFMAATSTNDYTQILKRKRTKRQRSSSPVCLTVTSCSSTGCGGAVIEDYGSITSSSEIYASTEEEEDMANCLILLAQGDFRKQGITDQGKGKINGGREISTGGGVYVYECKTCNRSFPSFQALGGHRASHKKPKSSSILGSMVVNLAVREIKEESNQLDRMDDVILQTVPMKNLKGKIHECSICGSEFASGQALGGHMRRHRANSKVICEMKPRNIMSLDLDLNLPAPAEEGEEESRSIELSSSSKFHELASTKQGLVFSAPAIALVGCHY